MDLLFGTDVREYGQHLGLLAGFELDPLTHQVRTILITTDGELSDGAATRPFGGVLIEPDSIEIRPYTAAGNPPDRGAVVLGRATRIIRGGREVGRVVGIDATVGSGDLEGIVGRKSWWTRRFHVRHPELDFSKPGEVRIASGASRAA